MSEHETPEAFESHRRPETPAPDPDRPDWLVGADEGAQAEQERGHQPSQQLKLVRPTAGQESPSGQAAKPPRPTAWKAAASSVPKLQRVEGAAPAQAAPAARARSVEPAWAPPVFDGGTAAKDDSLDAFPGEAPGGAGGSMEPDDPLAVPRTPSAPARRVHLEEPWWAVAVDALQTNRALQLGVFAVLLAVLAWFMWPRSQPTVSIRSIHDHPERYDGVMVRVQGRVGDVYEVGGAYAFYLEQGRDTIVVFSRVRQPYRNERLHVSGSVSMGYLDGIARPSLFESAE
jgi:hypothetical protein